MYNTRKRKLATYISDNDYIPGSDKDYIPGSDKDYIPGSDTSGSDTSGSDKDYIPGSDDDTSGSDDDTSGSDDDTSGSDDDTSGSDKDDTSGSDKDDTSGSDKDYIPGSDDDTSSSPICSFFDIPNKAAMKCLKNITKMRTKAIPSIEQVLAEPMLLKDKIRLVEYYEVLSSQYQGTDEWIDARDRLVRSFKEFRENYLEHLQFKGVTMVKKPKTAFCKSALKVKILTLPMSDANRSVLYTRYKELKRTKPDDDEYIKLKRWVDRALRLPYDRITRPSNAHIHQISRKLDDELYGMRDVKESILLFLNTKLRSPTMTGCSIGLVGPPGVGKTSIARTLATVMDYPFGQISVGGVTNVDFIKGHDYTYVGSGPGEISKVLMSMGAKNGIIFFDEYEKVADNSTIVSTLLHITDPSQNSDFKDNYFTPLSIDLSSIWFIYSMNELPADAALRDRIFVIPVKGYTTADKIQIAISYLFPRALVNINRARTDIQVSPDVARHIISHYDAPDEKGVRTLEKVVRDLVNRIHYLAFNAPDPNVPFSKAFPDGLAYPVTLLESHVAKLLKYRSSPLPESIAHLYT
jgi:ATP-dependent Lon protease